jgi:hypothetical protein
MKKFLLSLMIMAVVGTASKVNAQCAGANVSVFNITVVNQGAGVYDWSYNWIFVQGNASIQVVLKCGGTVVATSLCNDNLKDKPATQAVPGFTSGTLALPDVNCLGVRELEVRVYASSNCNGTFCSIGQPITLPVVFKSFDANRSRSNVAVKWETSSELNNAGFNVQRNIGGTWQTVAYVPSQATGGNSDATLTYSFNDLNTTKGISQYRIQQVDLDGKSKFSEVRAVRGEGSIGKTIVFPNPSNNGNVSIVFEDANVKRDVSVIDMTGKVIKQWRNVTNNNLLVENLPSGLFSVRILAVETGEQVVEKIVVNKR